MNYDYVIIGGGPTGLTLAWLLSQYKQKVLIIERESYIGGCHGVKRVNNLFSEHGPRIYIDNYLNFKEILKEMNINFNDIFIPYKFGINDFINSGINNLSIREIFILLYTFLKLNESYKNISLLEYIHKYNFSEYAINYLDNICRLSDGGGIEKFTLHSFLQILNQNLLYQIYQPKKPNDIGLFKLWYDALMKNNVEIRTNNEIDEIMIENNNIKYIKSNNNIIYGNKYILAIPPYQINELLNKFNLRDIFKNNFNDYAIKTNYITYIPITFHWINKIKIKKKWGFPESEWGIGHIVLSDYMDFENNHSKTVISSLITKHNKSKYLNKSPNEISDKDIIINEVFRQLQTILIDLPEYDYAIMSQNYYENNQWKSKHTAFMTTKYGYINNTSNIINNIYNCGVQNGNSNYYFTSMESAVTNAISLVHNLIPESKNKYIIKEIRTLRETIGIIILILIISLCIIYWHINCR
jgi:hypothetical protein